MENSFCTKCGSQIEANQKFCAHCGQKVGLGLDSDVSHSIAQFNAELGKKKKNKVLKVGLGIGIPCIVIILAVILFKVLTAVGGTYTCVSSQSENSYTFEKGKYQYKSEDERENGNYKVSGNKIILVDEEKDEDVYRRKGPYIYAEESCYEQKIASGATVDQILSKTASTSYKGTVIEVKISLKLYADGTYKYVSTLSADSYSEDIQNIDGKYKKEADKLILYPEDEEGANTYLIVDNKVYYSVYKK